LHSSYFYQDQRSPSPPYRSRTNYNTTSPSHPSTAATTAASAVTAKPNVNNPNTSGFSLSSASDDEAEQTWGAEKKPFSSYVPSRGSPNKSALNISAVNNSALYGKASGVVKVTKAATEFDVSMRYKFFALLVHGHLNLKYVPAS